MIQQFRSKITPQAAQRMHRQNSLKQQRKEALENTEDKHKPRPEPDDGDDASLQRNLLK